MQEVHRAFDLAMYELDFVEKGSDVEVDLTTNSLELEYVNEEWPSFGEINVNERWGWVPFWEILGEVHLESVMVEQSGDDDGDDEGGTGEQSGSTGE